MCITSCFYNHLSIDRGALAIFLGWLNLIVFISKFPGTGIYVVMFLDIFYTFLRLFFLSILLVIAFGLAFYMTFSEPTCAADVSLQYLHITIYKMSIQCSNNIYYYVMSYSYHNHLLDLQNNPPYLMNVF